MESDNRNCQESESGLESDDMTSDFTALVKMYCNFQFLCAWYQRYDILHVKNDQNSPKKSTNLFLYFPKYLHNFCITIFTNFGSWTFSVPNEYF